MTICALLLARQFYDLAAEPAAEVCDPRAAVRERLDRRDADALCRAARAHGGPSLGMGHAVHDRALRLAGGRRRSWSPTRCISLVPTRAGRARHATAVPEVDEAGGRDWRSPTHCYCRCRRGSSVVHVLFMAWTVLNSHYPALFVSGFLIFLGFAKATARTRAASS